MLLVIFSEEKKERKPPLSSVGWKTLRQAVSKYHYEWRSSREKNARLDKAIWFPFKKNFDLHFPPSSQLLKRWILTNFHGALQMVNIDQMTWSSADSHLYIQPLRTLLSVQKRFCSLLFFIFDWAGKHFSQNTQRPRCTLKPKALKDKCQDFNNLTLSGQNQQAATLPVSPPSGQGPGLPAGCQATSQQWECCWVKQRWWIKRQCVIPGPVPASDTRQHQGPAASLSCHQWLRASLAWRGHKNTGDGKWPFSKEGQILYYILFISHITEGKAMKHAILSGSLNPLRFYLWSWSFPGMK